SQPVGLGYRIAPIRGLRPGATPQAVELRPCGAFFGFSDTLYKHCAPTELSISNPTSNCLSRPCGARREQLGVLRAALVALQSLDHLHLLLRARRIFQPRKEHREVVMRA